MRQAANRRGFSIIDAVVAICIVGACFLALAAAISSITMQNADVEFSSTAIYLARGKMAETMAKDFDAIASVARTDFSGDFANYDFQVTVGYVASGALDAVVAGPTDYKRVVVDVGHNSWGGHITLYDLKVDLE